jgi:hypothetical protein
LRPQIFPAQRGDDTREIFRPLGRFFDKAARAFGMMQIIDGIRLDEGG